MFYIKSVPRENRMRCGENVCLVNSKAQKVVCGIVALTLLSTAISDKGDGC